MADEKPTDLVSTAWLAEHLHDDDVRVVDASWTLPNADRSGRDYYNEEHITGAVFWDIDFIADPSNPLPHMLPNAARFAGHMEGLGIGNDTFVVVYDALGLYTAARVWWMLRCFGHDAVGVLDGGLPKWKAEDHPVNAFPPLGFNTGFTARFQPTLVRSMDEVRQNIDSSAAQLVDARSAGRFKGADPEPREGVRSGHIPGSLNLPFGQLLDPADKTILQPGALGEKFRAAGIDPDKPVITSCGSGVTACIVALGLHLVGHRNVAVYDGSWSEWGAAKDAPVET
jgi:thiosulfate/3-mercaptopyruvate sulfurtransferase